MWCYSMITMCDISIHCISLYVWMIKKIDYVLIFYFIHIA